MHIVNVVSVNVAFEQTEKRRKVHGPSIKVSIRCSGWQVHYLGHILSTSNSSCQHCAHKFIWRNLIRQSLIMPLCVLRSKELSYHVWYACLRQSDVKDNILMT